MSKAYRATATDSSQEQSTKEEAEKASKADPGNAFMIDLLERAAMDAGAESSLLSFDDHEVDQGKYHFPEDKGEDQSGKYDFPEDDTRKQQAAPLPELRESHKDKSYEDHEKGTAFLKGAGDEHAVDPNDVKQGSLGDCYLMAGMIAVARANPKAIEDLIKDNGDGTFDVTLYMRDSYYGKPKKVTTTVDARLPSKAPGSPLYAKQGDQDGEQTELWAALLEKTVAQQKGSYDKISGGNIAKDGFQFHGATELLTGKSEGYMKTDGMDEDDALLHIAIALEEGKPVTCDSRNLEDDAETTKDATKVNVYWNHAYAPETVDLDGRNLSLTNPWGSSHVDKLPVKDFIRFYRAIRIGA